MTARLTLTLAALLVAGCSTKPAQPDRQMILVDVAYIEMLHAQTQRAISLAELSQANAETCTAGLRETVELLNDTVKLLKQMPVDCGELREFCVVPNARYQAPSAKGKP